MEKWHCRFSNTIIILHFPYCSFNFELLFEKALLDYWLEHNQRLSSAKEVSISSSDFANWKKWHWPSFYDLMTFTYIVSKYSFRNMVKSGATRKVKANLNLCKSVWFEYAKKGLSSCDYIWTWMDAGRVAGWSKEEMHWNGGDLYILTFLLCMWFSRVAQNQIPT